MGQKRRHYRTIFRQLACFTVVVSILPVMALSFMLYRKVEDMVHKELVDSYGQVASQYTENIREKLEQYEKSLIFVANNTVIMEQLENTEKGSYGRGSVISGEVFKSLLLDGQGELRNCMVYSARPQIPVYGTRAAMLEAAEKEYWFPYYGGFRGKWFFYPSLQPGGGSIASLAYGIEKVDVNSFGRRELGFVKMDIYMDKLFAPAGREDGERNFDVLVYDEKGKIWYSTDADQEAALEEILRVMAEAGADRTEKQEGAEGLETDGEILRLGDRMFSVSHLDCCGLNAALLFDGHGLAQKKAEAEEMILPVIALIVGIVILGSYLFARGFSGRVNRLVDKFKRVETGDLSPMEPIRGNDEITILDEQFSHMLGKLELLIQKNYVQELEKKETELENLQLQINPHFLYNTLETISSIAAVRQVFVVCDICEKLGEIFRYSLGKNYGEFVTVEQELHHVQNYIFIQKLRYGNKFEVFYNIAPGLERCMLLRFILQPVVENSIQHGIGPMTGRGTLEITVEEQEGMLAVRVEDDGVGMDSDQKEQLEAYMNGPEKRKEERGSIGVRNVNQRIKLSCGEAYGIKIKSTPYGGSSFQMTFPFRKKGEENDV